MATQANYFKIGMFVISGTLIALIGILLKVGVLIPVPDHEHEEYERNSQDVQDSSY